MSGVVAAGRGGPAFGRIEVMWVPRCASRCASLLMMKPDHNSKREIAPLGLPLGIGGSGCTR